MYRNNPGASIAHCFCVFEQDTFTSEKVPVIPRKRWLRPDMTEKLLTGTLNLNKTKTVLCSRNLNKLRSILISACVCVCVHPAVHPSVRSRFDLETSCINSSLKIADSYF